MFRLFRLPKHQDFERLDSNLFRPTADGPLLLNLGSYRHGLYQVEFDTASKKAKGDPQNTAFNASKAIEGAYEFQWEVDGKQWQVNPPSPVLSHHTFANTTVLKPN